MESSHESRQVGTDHICLWYDTCVIIKVSTILGEASIGVLDKWHQKVLDQKDFIIWHVIDVALLLDCLWLELVSLQTDEPADLGTCQLRHDLEPLVSQGCECLWAVSEHCDWGLSACLK